MKKVFCVICKKVLTKKQRYTCSVFCQGKHRALRMLGKRGSNSIRWKGGTIVIKGRVYLFMPTHKNARLNKNYVSRARYVLSTHLGRPLSDNEVVHHINGVVDDDRIENLCLLSRNKHTGIHASNRSPIVIKKFRERAKAQRRLHGKFA